MHLEFLSFHSVGLIGRAAMCLKNEGSIRAHFLASGPKDTAGKSWVFGAGRSEERLEVSPYKESVRLDTRFLDGRLLQ
jgi:hypothetical protein